MHEVRAVGEAKLVQRVKWSFGGVGSIINDFCVKKYLAWPMTVVL